MAYDEALAKRVRRALQDATGVTERKMFGGIAFMVNGNMCCGIQERNLVVRTGPHAYDNALTRPHARVCDFTGKPMKGLVMVAHEGIRRSDSLKRWVRLGTGYACSLPVKQPK
ncbi:MAG: TfoX/Sxy family protein [Pseudomonadota bacterium]|nr:MAG: TfoX/Sxy family protein [Pseudomonadota bacterium]